MRRVAITGMGAICALGRTIAEVSESLRQGRPSIAAVESCDMSQMRFQNGAEVRGYTHQPYFDDRRADFMDRFAQFAVSCDTSVRSTMRQGYLRRDAGYLPRSRVSR